MKDFFNKIVEALKISNIIKAFGGRKMSVFVLVFITLTTLFVLGFDILKYAEALKPFVITLVIGNVGEHIACIRK